MIRLFGSVSVPTAPYSTDGNGKALRVLELCGVSRIILQSLVTGSWSHHLSQQGSRTQFLIQGSRSVMENGGVE